ncbi:MAG: TolC family protein [Breznakibacter sp.]
MKATISILALLAGMPLWGQNNVNPVLAAVEENNTTLKAFRQTVEAQKLENKTGIYLAGPEADFGYLWGNPGEIGNRTDISVRQTFDIPTITGMKSKLANGQNGLLDIRYKTERMNILLEAKQYCLDLIYYNALRKELDVRLQHAETIARGYQSRLERGDASRLEYNKAQLNLSSVRGEASRVDAERHALLLQLKRLNGGNEVAFDDYLFAPAELPLDFDQWYATASQKNPELAYVKGEAGLGKTQISVSKAMGLPSFSAGYMGEKVVGQHYQGVSVGVSIPLWENRNRVKQAKMAMQAAESRVIDSNLQLYGNLQLLHKRALGLKVTAETYQHALSVANNTDLLKKALDSGDISLLDYVLEVGLYYHMANQALEAERDFQKAFSELTAADL